MSPSVPDGREVFDEWSLYETVIHLNYMRHREMIAAIQTAVAAISEPLDVLDLGCGDGAMACQGFARAKVNSYFGCDLSRAALDKAAGTLHKMTPKLTLREASLVTTAASDDLPELNCLLASYSLHHLDRQAEIQRVLESCRRRLKQEGIFIWIDLQRQYNETREDYLLRFRTKLLPTWTGLTEPQRQEVIDHMQAADFPLSFPEKSALCRAAGFRDEQCLFEDDNYAAHLYQVSRKSLNPID